VDGALARYADEVYAELEADEQVMARRILCSWSSQGKAPPILAGSPGASSSARMPGAWCSTWRTGDWW